MNVTLYGATGKAGARILKELLDRSHRVTAMVRDPTKLQQQAGLTVRAGDLSDPSNIAEAVHGADAVVSAYGPGLQSPNDLIGATERLVAGVKQGGVRRLLHGRRCRHFGGCAWCAAGRFAHVAARVETHREGPLRSFAKSSDLGSGLDVRCPGGYF